MKEGGGDRVALMHVLEHIVCLFLQNRLMDVYETL